MCSFFHITWWMYAEQSFFQGLSTLNPDKLRQWRNDVASTSTADMFRNITHSLTRTEEWQSADTSQQRTSCDTTAYSLLSSAYWYLIGGVVPSSRDTTMNISSTLRFNSCCFCTISQHNTTATISCLHIDTNTSYYWKISKCTLHTNSLMKNLAGSSWQCDDASTLYMCFAPRYGSLNTQLYYHTVQENLHWNLIRFKKSYLVKLKYIYWWSNAIKMSLLEQYKSSYRPYAYNYFSHTVISQQKN
jgi:hypothetical protein